MPKPYYGKSSSKATKAAKKKQEKKKADPKPKPVADKKPAGDGQLSLLDLGMAKAG